MRPRLYDIAELICLFALIPAALYGLPILAVALGLNP